MNNKAEFAFRFAELAVIGLWEAVTSAVQDAVLVIEPSLLLTGSQIFGVFATRMLEVFDKFTNKLGQILPRAALQTIVEVIDAPKWTKTRSLSADRAYTLCVEEILNNSISLIDGRLPFALRLVDTISNRSKVFSLVFNPTLEKFLGYLLKPFKMSMIRILNLAWTIISLCLNFFIGVVGILILSGFLTSGERRLEDLCFPQTARRKRFRIVGGKSIRRRTPGGSPP